MSDLEKYDLCIIGGGPAGYAAAMRAVDFRKKVVLIEKDKLGGAGIYNGALTSKTMWELSTRISNTREEIKHLTAGQDLFKEISIIDQFGISYQNVLKTVKEAVFDRKFQLQCHIKLLQTEAYKKYFTYERGVGKLLNKHEVSITKTSASGIKKDKVIYAENIIISTGSRPRSLPGIPVDEKIIVTSDGIHAFENYPQSLVILGAGVIGCEFATIFANLRKTKVNIIDKADRILPFEDEDLVKVIAENFEKNGITIHHDAKLERMDIIDGEVEYELLYKDGKREVIRVEKALLSIGRMPNVEGLGLKEAGVKLSDMGYIKDDDTQTNIPNIYAIGDVSAHVALVNVGELEGRRAVEKMFGKSDKKITYENISTIMFLNPEVAAVGINEQQAIEQGTSYRLVKIDYSCIARAIAMRRTQGFFKILVTDDEEMKILGMRAIGEHASSAIQAVALLISMNKGIVELADLIHPHPSIIEGIQECLRMLLGKSIFKAEVFGDKLECCRCVNGVKTPLEHLN